MAPQIFLGKLRGQRFSAFISLRAIFELSVFSGSHHDEWEKFNPAPRLKGKGLKPRIGQ
jgi:hypothetical protein